MLPIVLLVVVLVCVGEAYPEEENLCFQCRCRGETIECLDQVNWPERLIVDEKYKRLTLIKAGFRDQLDSRLTADKLRSMNHLESLKITHSGLRTIDPRAFAGMRNLRELDLTHNKLTRINAGTFAGLNLNLLQLGDQQSGSLALDLDAFQGLRAEVVSLKSSSLHELDMDIFGKIGGLKKLLLANNSIRGLDQSVKDYFDTEQHILDLTMNPLSCRCNINWLAERSLQWSRSAPGLSMTCQHMEKNRAMTKDLVNVSGDKLCPKTQIDQIEIDLNEAARLSCRATSEMALLDESVQAPKVIWSYATDREQFTRQSMSKKSSERFSTTVSVEFNPRVNNYTCEAQGENQSRQKITVNIKGFPLPVPATAQTTLSSMKTVELEGDTFRDQHVLFQKQFTLFEMIGAITGTFILTLVLLLTSSRCYMVFCRKRRKDKPLKHQEQQQQHEALMNGMTTTTTRAAGASSNSSGATLNPLLIYPPGTPGPNFIQKPHNLQQQQFQQTLSHAALMGYWPAAPGSPYSINSHEYDIPRNTGEFGLFDQPKT